VTLEESEKSTAVLPGSGLEAGANTATRAG
jgi:hypothetical protein